MFHLNINKKITTTLTTLTLPQIIKLTKTNQLIYHFHFNNHQTITQLTQNSHINNLQQIHTNIILSTHLLNNINQPKKTLHKKKT